MDEGQERLRRLQEIREALQHAPEPGGSRAPDPDQGAASADPDALTPRPPAIPPKDAPATGPWVELLDACPHCGEPVLAGTPCPRCAMAPAGPGLPTTVLLKGERRGPAWLQWLAAQLSPLAEIEPVVRLGAFLVLFVLCGIAVLFVHNALIAGFIDRGAGVFLRVFFAVVPFLVPLLFLVTEAVWRLTIIPSVSATLTRLLWAPQRQRVQVEVQVKADSRARESWREALRAAFSLTETPARPLALSCEAIPLPGGRQVDLRALFIVRHQEVRGAFILLDLRDGRRICLDARDLRFRAQRCPRCDGGGQECPLCGGDGRVRSAVL